MEIIGDRYVLINEIEKASTTESKLYSGKCIINNEGVAVKVIDLHSSGDAEIKKELFNREYQSLSRLQHKNIVKYVSSGQDGNKLYIAMEFLYHKTLKEYIDENEVDIEDQLRIGINIVEAIAFAHEKGVIHRDLKPLNIMINTPEDIKLIDFGISKILNNIYNDDSTVKRYMTPKYAAPEQLLMQDAKPQIDIYSCGLILAYIFSGKEPPENKEYIEKYIQSINCSENIKSLISRMTYEESQKRVQSMYEVKRFLEKEISEFDKKIKKIYINCNAFINRKLLEFGMIHYSKKEYTLKFLREDLKSSSIYKGHKPQQYYVVGNNIKYECKLDNSKNFLDIQRINCFEDHIDWKKEYDRGLEIRLQWTPIYEKNGYTEDNYLEFLIQDIIDKERIRKVEKEKNDLKCEVLEQWNQLLQEEFSDVDKKKNVCKYKTFKIHESGYKILVEAYDIDIDIDIKQEDIIQMTNKKGNQINVGELISFDNNIISIKLNQDINPSQISEVGTLGIDVSNDRNTLRKLGRALNQIRTSNSVNTNLSEIISRPDIIQIDTIKKINRSDYFQDILKQSNSVASLDAVEKALATKDISLIQGPPGTGKTTVITEIVCQILKDEPNAKILLASQSHVAVDNVVSKVNEIIPDKRIIRIGRSDRVSAKSKNLIMSEQLNRWVESVKESSQNELDAYKKDNIRNLERGLNIDNIDKITREWHRRLGKLEEFDEIFAAKSSIVAATCLGIASRNVLNDMEFDWVIVDEAARATPLELLVPIVRGGKILLVGDHRQLPPVVKTNIDKIRLEEKGIKEYDLEKSLFEDLYEKMPDESKSVLTSQYRMHPDISKLVSDIFYPSIKIDSGVSASDREHKLKWSPRSIKWIDTSMCLNNKEKNENLSKKNDAEAKVILNQLEEIEKEYKNKSIYNITVSVISGYNEQKKLLDNLIKPADKKKWNHIKILIDNVDAFQGSETDIVIYSLVRNNPNFKIGFLYDERRLNVALSRGRNGLIIVGDIVFAEKARSFRGNPFSDVIRFIKRNHKSCLIEVYNEN
ncbi:Serine/threonine-protein kinase PknD [Terrisporobacter petrolearius]|uniref:AAA domain-containing protein n=1 Tax=Terrisporobacter petrolearius TaxID=1460447 RepID=UPI0033676430